MKLQLYGPSGLASESQFPANLIAQRYAVWSYRLAKANRV